MGLPHGSATAGIGSQDATRNRAGRDGLITAPPRDAGRPLNKAWESSRGRETQLWSRGSVHRCQG